MRFSSSPLFISVVCYDKIRSWNRATLIALKGKKWGEVWLKITFGLNIFSAASLFATNCSTVKDARTSFLEWGVHRARLFHLSFCGQDTESKYGGAGLLFFVLAWVSGVSGGKGEIWKRKRERAEGEKCLTQMLLLEPSNPTQHDSIPSNQNHF